MLQISQTCWQNLTVVFSGLWASTHVLSDEPSRAWQSSVLLAQLGTGCSLCPLSAPDFLWLAALASGTIFMYTRCSKALITPLMDCFAALSHLSFFVLPNSCPGACAFVLTPCCMPGIPVGWNTSSEEGHNMPGALKGTPSACKDCWVQWKMGGFNTCAQCIRRQILQGEILSAI